MKLKSSRQDGGVMVLALVFSAAIGIGLGSYFALVRYFNTSSVRSAAWNSALPVSEAGIEEALTQLNMVNGGNLQTNGWALSNGLYSVSRTMGLSRYTVTIDSSLQPTVVSTAYIAVPGQSVEVTRAVQVTTTRASSLMRGMVAKNNVSMNGNCAIDSFDSSNPLYSTGGAYDATKRKDGGFAGSVSGNVDTGGGTIAGSIGTGPTGSASGNVGDFAWLASNSGIQSGHYKNDLNLAFPDVAVPFTSGYYAAPQNISVSMTNLTYLTTATNSTVVPSPIPASGVSTNFAPITTVTKPATWSGTLTTNTTFTSSLTSPAAGTYVGNVVTRIVSNGPQSGRGTWYDYSAITGYTYSTTVYTYNLVTTNSTVTTQTYDYVLGSANYQMTSLSMSGQSTMLINGDAVLYITGSMSMSGQSQIIIAPGASLKVYVGSGTTSLTGNGILNMNNDASKFSYYGLPGNTGLRMQGNAAFTGSIYAPNADFTLGGGGNNTYDCVGATVTKSVTMNGHFNFHYDENLGRNGASGRFTVASWTEL